MYSYERGYNKIMPIDKKQVLSRAAIAEMIKHMEKQPKGSQGEWVLIWCNITKRT